jgi:predicted DNA-binding transcriptional regulator YafY
MARRAGRDQIGPMERLVRILICLSDAGPKGVRVRKLLRMADLDDDTEANRAQLRRHLGQLRQGGWNIRNIAPDGEDARYALDVDDNRLAVLLNPGERAALRQVLRDAEADLASPPDFLGALQHAAQDRCLLRFTYKGVRRRVHPDSLYASQSGWVLVGREDGARITKEFVAARMSHVRIDDPGTAEPPDPIGLRSLDPTSWLIDPPRVVTLGVPPDFVADVLRLMSGGEVVGTDRGEVVVELVVTNRAAFRCRLFELGMRVRVLSPPELVSEILRSLHAVVSLPSSGGVDGDLR